MVAKDTSETQNVRPTPEGLMTMDDVARLLGREIQTVRNMVARREIPFVRIGRQTRFLSSSIWLWIKEKEVKPYGSN